MNDQLKQRLVGAIVLVSLAVIILPEIFKGEGTVLEENDVPPQPDYRFPPPSEVPEAPPMAKAPIVPVGDAAKESPEKESADKKKVLADKSQTKKVEEEQKAAPVVSRDSAGSDTDKKTTQANSGPAKKEAKPVVSKPGQVNAFIVQVGSFSSEPNAVALRDRLRKMGFASFVEAVKGKEGMVYRVRVGPELTQKLADNLKADLAKKANINGLVQTYP